MLKEAHNSDYQLPLASADVCLVCMPYCSTVMPSLALGLLQSVLVNSGISTTSVYANLLFSKQIGINLYEEHHHSDPRLPVSEWTFASSAFPEFESDDERFVEEIHAKLGHVRKQSLAEIREELFFVRQAAEQFTTRLARQILDLSPRIVGCTSSLSQRVPSLALLRKIHELDPKVITMMGGADCETIMGRATHQHFNWVDYVVSGEAEDIVVPLSELIFEHGRQVPLDELPEGVIAPLHRETDYKEYMQDGDKLPPRAVASSFTEQLVPMYHDYFALLESLPTLGEIVRPSLPIQASRGCWHGKCKFCGLNAPQVPYRSRPAAAVLAELDELNSTYGVEHFEFLDNILDMRCFDDLISELIRRGAPYKLFFEVRSSMSQKHFEMLRAAGVVWCQPGIESLHSEALQAMQKGVTAWQNIQTLKWCRQFGIHVYWSILYDFPKDQDSWYEEMAELVPLITHLYPLMGMTDIQYQRNSHYFEQADEYSLKLATLPLDSLIYPLDQEAIEELSYTLEDEFTALKKNDPNMAVIFHRPGLEKLRSELRRWAVMANSENRPILKMQITDDQIVVTDTRPVAVAPTFHLTGLQKEVYLVCIEATQEVKVREMHTDKGYTSSEIEAAIQSLLDNKLLIRIDHRLLALAVEEPYLDYVPKEQSPMGWINRERD